MSKVFKAQAICLLLVGWWWVRYRGFFEGVGESTVD